MVQKYMDLFIYCIDSCSKAYEHPIFCLRYLEKLPLSLSQEIQIQKVTFFCVFNGRYRQLFFFMITSHIDFAFFQIKIFLEWSFSREQDSQSQEL